VLKEREQLAFEMHDTLAQSFTGIAYQLQAASTERRGEGMIQTHIRHALEMVHISHREASRAIAALRPHYRDAAGILDELNSSAERLCDGGELLIATKLNGKMIELPLEVTDVFFRIGQEAISNAIQHSGCKALTISLSLSRREARLSVSDDGHGFAKDEMQPGLGIESMRKRTATINALFDLESTPGKGTTVTVTASSLVARGPLYRLRAKLFGAS
jgi:signal transduction histidine kinase